MSIEKINLQLQEFCTQNHPRLTELVLLKSCGDVCTKLNHASNDEALRWNYALLPLYAQNIDALKDLETEKLKLCEAATIALAKPELQAAFLKSWHSRGTKSFQLKQSLPGRIDEFLKSLRNQSATMQEFGTRAASGFNDRLAEYTGGDFANDKANNMWCMTDQICKDFSGFIIEYFEQASKEMIKFWKEKIAAVSSIIGVSLPLPFSLTVNTVDIRSELNEGDPLSKALEMMSVLRMGAYNGQELGSQSLGTWTAIPKIPERIRGQFMARNSPQLRNAGREISKKFLEDLRANGQLMQHYCTCALDLTQQVNLAKLDFLCLPQFRDPQNNKQVSIGSIASVDRSKFKDNISRLEQMRQILNQEFAALCKSTKASA